MLLLTGATGQVGAALLRRLLAEGVSVRCLVRDPRRLGAQRVRVQIALGDLTDPPSFRNAMRGVETVVHLAGSTRDQRRGSIEELNGIATWRMVQAARESGVQRFVFFSALGASTHHRGRFFRAKAHAERAVLESGLRCILFAPSLVYSPHDRWLRLLERLSLLPVVPVAGGGKALYQPIWSEDVADCVAIALRSDLGTNGAEGMNGAEEAVRGDAHRSGPRYEPRRAGPRHELAGPETLSHDEIVRIVLRSQGRGKPLLHLPTAATSRSLRLLERAMGERTPVTWDEAELLQVPMLAERGSADVRALGVSPQRIAAVLGTP